MVKKPRRPLTSLEEKLDTLLTKASTGPGMTRTIAYHRVFAAVAGGALPGLFLSQCWFWSTRTAEDAEGWFYKTIKEWESETGMTRREVDTARKMLGKDGAGLLEEEQRPGKGKERWIYYRLDTARLALLVGRNWLAVYPDGSAETPHE